MEVLHQLPCRTQGWSSFIEKVPFSIQIALAILGVLIVVVTRSINQINKESAQITLTRSILPEEEHLLEGLYYISSAELGQRVKSSARLHSVGNGEFYVTIYSDYSPVELYGQLLSDGSFQLEGLGTGEVVYKPASGTIKIKFNNQTSGICEFIK